MQKIDYLTEDNILPDNQKFVCLSFLTDKDDKDKKIFIRNKSSWCIYNL